MNAEPTNPTDARITVYWRPGCGFCARLFRELDARGIAHERVDIWADEEGAAYVRSVARGNETVPTVDVAGTALVNPSIDRILAVAGSA